jgi:molybdate transport system ATP-binding protein
MIRFAGETWYDAERAICRPPQARGIGLMVQEYALFPHLTVAQNVAFGLRRTPRLRQRALVESVLERFELQDLGDRRPHQISGGEQQRVALARVLVRRPRLLLLDEPLSALDAGTRETARRQLRKSLQEFAIPVIMVTHDRLEAMTLADQILVMDRGEILQRGSVAHVMGRPRDLRVARIVGVETVVEGDVLQVDAGLAQVRVGNQTLTAVAPLEPARLVYVCILSENVSLQRGVPPEQSPRNRLAARIVGLAREGPLVRVSLDCGFTLSALITPSAREELNLAEGDEITACVKAPAVHLIPRT